MGNIYRSPYEAYPFLADGIEDLRCDFELMTDELSSLTGLLAAKIRFGKEGKDAAAGKEADELAEELVWIDELIYHANPTLRTFCSIRPEEIQRLEERTRALMEQAAGDVHRFVLPCGCETAALAHVLRVKGKELVRLLYRHIHQGHETPKELVDFANLLSGYFFGLALKLNRTEKVGERDFVSRNY